MAPRKQAPRTKDKTQLATALYHVEIASHGVAAYAPYCMFTTGWLVGYDSVVAAGYRIVEDLPGIAPHTETMHYAVARAGNPYSLTVHSDKLTVRGHAVKVDVPICRPDQIPNVVPDVPYCEIGEPVREALISAGKIVKARNEYIIASAVLLGRNSVVGTDGGTVLEAYHGGNLPCRWMLPAEFVLAVAAVKHKPTHIGWSDETFTIWYGKDCWLRTNVYMDKYPDTDLMFATMTADTPELRPVPADMLLALETIKPFLEDDTITLWEGGINTKPDGTGASYGFAHHLPPQPRMLPYMALKLAAQHGEWIGFNRRGFYWYGPQLRGISASEQKL